MISVVGVCMDENQKREEFVQYWLEGRVSHV